VTGLRASIRTAEGWAVENAVLTMTDLTGQQVARVVTDPKGAVATEALPPGVYTAVITSPGHNPVARTAQIGSDGSGSLGDIILAEPRALIGFAGPKVIAQTVRVQLPAGFQTSEFLLDHGFIDRIVHRRDLRSMLALLIGYTTP